MIVLKDRGQDAAAAQHLGHCSGSATKAQQAHRHGIGRRRGQDVVNGAVGHKRLQAPANDLVGNAPELRQLAQVGIALVAADEVHAAAFGANKAGGQAGGGDEHLGLEAKGAAQPHHHVFQLVCGGAKLVQRLA